MGAHPNTLYSHTYHSLMNRFSSTLMQFYVVLSLFAWFAMSEDGFFEENLLADKVPQSEFQDFYSPKTAAKETDGEGSNAGLVSMGTDTDSKIEGTDVKQRIPIPMDTIPQERSPAEHLLPLARNFLQKPTEEKTKPTCFNQYKLKHKYKYAMKTKMLMQAKNVHTDTKGSAKTGS